MKLIAVLLTCLIPLGVIAQEGDPCLAGENCPRMTVESYPETGIWFNPDEPGSGFMFEIQNRMLAGYYFGYDSEGRPAWYLISGLLEFAEKDNLTWSLTAPLFGFQGGSCIGCLYQEPGEPDSAGTITIEFITRATARFTVDGETWHRSQSFTYGTGGEVVFPGSDYPMPNLDGQWLMIVYDREAEMNLSRQFAASGHDVWITTGEREPGRIYYLILNAMNAPELQFIADIECVTSENQVGGTCTLRQTQPPMEPKEFYMPATAISDSYFRAVADDEDTFEAFRVNYD